MEVFPVVYVLLAGPAGLALDRLFRPTPAVGASGRRLRPDRRAVGDEA